MIKGSITTTNNLPAKGEFNSAMRETIASLTFTLAGLVKSKYLSGGALNRKKGDLSRSINAKFEDAGMTGVVGTNTPYGRIHEYGLVATIEEHLRMMTQAFGRPVANPRQITVREHIAHYPERSFLRAALRDLDPQIKTSMQKAAKGVIHK